MKSKKWKMSPSVNITPLVDVLLILVVVLMLLMPVFLKKLPVELPNTQLTSSPVSFNTVRIALAKDGTVYFQGSPAPLKFILSNINSKSQVELDIDKHVVYADITTLIEKIQEKNPKDISLITH